MQNSAGAPCSNAGMAYPLGEVAGLVDVPIPLLFQLKDDLPLLLGLVLVVLDLLLQVPLGLLVKLHQVHLLLGRTDCLKHILKNKGDKSGALLACSRTWGSGYPGPHL